MTFWLFPPMAVLVQWVEEGREATISPEATPIRAVDRTLKNINKIKVHFSPSRSIWTKLYMGIRKENEQNRLEYLQYSKQS